ncbi:uncharacterized protein BJ171DRAFT_595945 [Polychytrium aggregatum]|uniref:uncharacterized protein n=1 Tax=Polychytrium aggregatum TaxID=110093 RepID=UPI0022FE46B8|nr:uncharacterized protein BJ171DRAFT_595945 [Polychytrium aggregatum]KAI9208133.1 hypothetical protein BJ171DRAFT_595945 [Polychytrium aggregatum]
MHPKQPPPKKKHDLHFISYHQVQAPMPKDDDHATSLLSAAQLGPKSSPPIPASASFSFKLPPTPPTPQLDSIASPSASLSASSSVASLDSFRSRPAPEQHFIQYNPQPLLPKTSNPVPASLSSHQRIRRTSLQPASQSKAVPSLPSASVQIEPLSVPAPAPSKPSDLHQSVMNFTSTLRHSTSSVSLTSMPSPAPSTSSVSAAAVAALASGASGASVAAPVDVADEAAMHANNLITAAKAKLDQRYNVVDSGLQLRVMGLPQQNAKSRVETQIKICLQLVTDKGEKASSWAFLRLPEYLASKEKPHKKFDKAPSENNVLDLDAIVICASDFDRPVTTCTTCLQRELKRAQKCTISNRQKAVKLDSDSTPGQMAMMLDDSDPIATNRASNALLFSCSRILDFAGGDIILPTRITCYCRHHHEKVGFCIYFMVRDKNQRIIATSISPPIMITDDHKSSKVKNKTLKRTREAEEEATSPVLDHANPSRDTSPEAISSLLTNLVFPVPNTLPMTHGAMPSFHDPLVAEQTFKSLETSAALARDQSHLSLISVEMFPPLPVSDPMKMDAAATPESFIFSRTASPTPIPVSDVLGSNYTPQSLPAPAVSPPALKMADASPAPVKQDGLITTIYTPMANNLSNTSLPTSFITFEDPNSLNHFQTPLTTFPATTTPMQFFDSQSSYFFMPDGQLKPPATLSSGLTANAAAQASPGVHPVTIDQAQLLMTTQAPAASTLQTLDDRQGLSQDQKIRTQQLSPELLLSQQLQAIQQLQLLSQLQSPSPIQSIQSGISALVSPLALAQPVQSFPDLSQQPIDPTQHMFSMMASPSQPPLPARIPKTLPNPMRNLPPEAIPSINRVIPSEGPICGGLEITVLGTGFYNGLTVKFGDVCAEPTHFWSSNTMICTLPPSPMPGVVPVTFKDFPQMTHGVFTYKDDTEMALMELALQVVGLRMTGQLDNARNIAMQIVNSASSATQRSGTASASSHGGSTRSALSLARLRGVVRSLVAERMHFSSATSSKTRLEVALIQAFSTLNQILDEDEEEARHASEGDGPSEIGDDHFDEELQARSHERALRNLHQQNKTGHSILHLCCLGGLTTLSKWILASVRETRERGIRSQILDCQDANGFTPLHFATLCGRVDLVEELLEAGARADILNNQGFFARDLAVKNGHDPIVKLFDDRIPVVDITDGPGVHEADAVDDDQIQAELEAAFPSLMRDPGVETVPPLVEPEAVRKLVDGHVPVATAMGIRRIYMNRPAVDLQMFPNAGVRASAAMPRSNSGLSTLPPPPTMMSQLPAGFSEATGAPNTAASSKLAQRSQRNSLLASLGMLLSSTDTSMPSDTAKSSGDKHASFTDDATVKNSSLFFRMFDLAIGMLNDQTSPLMAAPHRVAINVFHALNIPGAIAPLQTMTSAFGKGDSRDETVATSHKAPPPEYLAWALSLFAPSDKRADTDQKPTATAVLLAAAQAAVSPPVSPTAKTSPAVGGYTSVLDETESDSETETDPAHSAQSSRLLSVTVTDAAHIAQKRQETRRREQLHQERMLYLFWIPMLLIMISLALIRFILPPESDELEKLMGEADGLLGQIFRYNSDIIRSLKQYLTSLRANGGIMNDLWAARA